MTTLQKTLIAATLAVAVSTGIYEARQASRLRDQVQTLRQQRAAARRTNRAAQIRNESLSNQLVQANRSPSLSTDRLRELLKLRGKSDCSGDNSASSSQAAAAAQSRPMDRPARLP